VDVNVPIPRLRLCFIVVTMVCSIACVLAHTFPVYNRGEPEYVSRRESRVRPPYIYILISFQGQTA
jgi:hypothetical protein